MLAVTCVWSMRTVGRSSQTSFPAALPHPHQVQFPEVEATLIGIDLPSSSEMTIAGASLVGIENTSERRH